MVVTDEHGWSWTIQPSDPVASLASRLTRLGYQSLILPRTTILTGTLNGGPSIEDLESEARAYHTLADIVDGHTLESLSAAFLHRMTYYDICKELPNVV